MAEGRQTRGRGRGADMSRGWTPEQSFSGQSLRDSGGDAWSRGGWVDQSLTGTAAGADAAFSMDRVERGGADRVSGTAQASNGFVGRDAAASEASPTVFNAGGASTDPGDSRPWLAPGPWRMPASVQGATGCSQM